MKKTFLTISIILGIAFSGIAQQGGGLFGRGYSEKNNVNQTSSNRDGGSLLTLPNEHGFQNDTEATTTPLGSGIAVLMGLGGAYLVAKRRKED